MAVTPVSRSQLVGRNSTSLDCGALIAYERLLDRTTDITDTASWGVGSVVASAASVEEGGDQKPGHSNTRGATLQIQPWTPVGSAEEHASGKTNGACVKAQWVCPDFENAPLVCILRSSVLCVLDDPQREGKEGRSEESAALTASTQSTVLELTGAQLQRLHEALQQPLHRRLFSSLQHDGENAQADASPPQQAPLWRPEPTCTTEHTIPLEGAEWEMVVEDSPGDVHRALIDDVASICHVPNRAVTQVQWDLEHLHATCAIRHPVQWTRALLQEALGRGDYPAVQAVYAARHDVRDALDEEATRQRQHAARLACMEEEIQAAQQAEARTRQEMEHMRELYERQGQELSHQMALAQTSSQMDYLDDVREQWALREAMQEVQSALAERNNQIVQLQARLRSAQEEVHQLTAAADHVSLERQQSRSMHDPDEQLERQKSKYEATLAEQARQHAAALADAEARLAAATTARAAAVREQELLQTQYEDTQQKLSVTKDELKKLKQQLRRDAKEAEKRSSAVEKTQQQRLTDMQKAHDTSTTELERKLRAAQAALLEQGKLHQRELEKVRAEARDRTVLSTASVAVHGAAADLRASSPTSTPASLPLPQEPQQPQQPSQQTASRLHRKGPTVIPVPPTPPPATPPPPLPSASTMAASIVSTETPVSPTDKKKKSKLIGRKAADRSAAVDAIAREVARHSEVVQAHGQVADAHQQLMEALAAQLRAIEAAAAWCESDAQHQVAAATAAEERRLARRTAMTNLRARILELARRQSEEDGANRAREAPPQQQQELEQEGMSASKDTLITELRTLLREMKQEREDVTVEVGKARRTAAAMLRTAEAAEERVKALRHAKSHAQDLHHRLHKAVHGEAAQLPKSASTSVLYAHTAATTAAGSAKTTAVISEAEEEALHTLEREVDTAADRLRTVTRERVEKEQQRFKARAQEEADVAQRMKTGKVEPEKATVEEDGASSKTEREKKKHHHHHHPHRHDRTATGTAAEATTEDAATTSDVMAQRLLREIYESATGNLPGRPSMLWMHVCLCGLLLSAFTTLQYKRYRT